MLLLQRLAARRAYLAVRLPRIIRRPPTTRHSPSLRVNSSTARTTPVPRRPNVQQLPERTIIYHAGTPRTVFLGCTKVTTIFICVFFCAVMAPTHLHGEESNWVAAGVMASGLIPFAYVTYTSAPFVTYIHLRLPGFARQSQAMLLRYSRTLPKHAELDITTMNLVGRPRVARVRLQDIYPVRRRFGFANYARDTRALDAKRPWYARRAVALFGVHNEKSGILGGQVWENVAAAIAKNKRM